MGKGNPKNQKKFIDKKNAVSFHLVHRSQRDPLASDALASSMVLQPTFVPHDRDYATMDPEVVDMLNADNMEEMLAPDGELAFDSDDDDDAAGGDDDDDAEDGGDAGKDKKKKQKKKKALPHDYDYSKHMKEIDAGQFQRYKFADEGVLGLASVRGAAHQTQDEYDAEHKNDDVPEEYEDDGQGGATEEHFGLRLPVSVLPSDMQRDYTGSSAHDEIDRRFNDIQGSVEPSQDFYMALNSELFDEAEDDQFGGVFEAIQDDFVSAAMKDPDEEQLEDMRDIDERHQQRDEERAAADQAERDARPARAIDDDFERALAGYDDEEIGELYSDDERLEGDVDDVAETFDDVLDEFLQQKEKNMDTMTKNEGGSGADGVDEHQKKHVTVGLGRLAAEPDVTDAADSAALREQFTPAERETWDCETIISTYSNLENHPHVVKEPRRNAGHRLIKIDDRSGLPSQYTSAKLRQQRVAAKKNLAAKKTTASAGATSTLYDDDDDDNDDEEKKADEEQEEWIEPVNQGAKRKKGETKEEKKARKEQAKLNKQAARGRKKELKSMYKMETKVQVKAVTSNTAANPPAIKF